MFIIHVNGKEINFEKNLDSELSEYLELIQNTIGDDQVIIDIALDGNSVGEEIFSKPIRYIDGNILEIITESPSKFISQSWNNLNQQVESIFHSIDTIKEYYFAGEIYDGNKLLDCLISTARNVVASFHSLKMFQNPEDNLPEQEEHLLKKINSHNDSLIAGQMNQDWKKLIILLDREFRFSIFALRNLIKDNIDTIES